MFLILGLLWCKVGFAKCMKPNRCVFKNDDGSFFKGICNRETGKKDVGIFTYANGDIYTGNFGQIYEGNPAHEKRHGSGTLLKTNGDKYVGVWEFGKLIIGTYTKDNGSVKYFPKNKKIIKKNNIKKWKAFKYILDEGTFEKGKGIIFYDHGGIYVGEFKEGKRDGRGFLYSSKGERPCDPIGIFDGPWKDDEWRGPIF